MSVEIKSKYLLSKLPIVIHFKDYHEIPIFAKDVNLILDKDSRISCEEIGMDGMNYLGIFFIEKDDEYLSLKKEWEEESLNESN